MLFSDALVTDVEGQYLNRPFLSGSPFPIPTFRPACTAMTSQASHLATCDPGRELTRGLPGANSNPTTVRPGAALGYANRARVGSAERTRFGYGEGSSY